MMNKKIIGNLVCILFFGASILPVVSGINSKLNQQVKLQPSEEISQDSRSKPLNSNEPPIADFDYSQNPDNKFEFWFEDKSTDVDGYIDEWFWEFNDGYVNYSTEQNPIVDFSRSAGQILPVCLWVWDDDGTFDSVEKNVKIPEKSLLLEEYNEKFILKYQLTLLRNRGGKI